MNSRLYGRRIIIVRECIYGGAVNRMVHGGEAGILYSTIVSRLNLRPKSLNSSSTGL